jgi:hypothetical protein
MVTTAEMLIIALKERSGSSRQAIRKCILATYSKEP